MLLGPSCMSSCGISVKGKGSSKVSHLKALEVLLVGSRGPFTCYLGVLIKV